MLKKVFKNFNYVFSFIAGGAGFLYGYDIILMKLVFIMDSFRIYYGLATWNGFYRDTNGNTENIFDNFRESRNLVDTDDNNFIEGVITAGHVFGSICGALIISYLGDRLGRRKTMIVTSLVFAVGAFLQVCSSRSYFWIAICRFILGLSFGSFNVICPVYISELIPAKSRGEISYLYYMLMIVGIIFSGIINGYIFYKSDFDFIELSSISRKDPSEPINNMAWRLAFLIQTFISILYSGLLFIIPKSPRWLCFDECNVEALQTMAKIYNTTSLSDTKLQEKFDNIKNDAIINRAIGHSNYSELFIPSIRRRTFNIIFMNSIQQWSGITFFLCFHSQIFSGIGSTEFESLIVIPIILISILSFFIIFVCFSLIDRYGRKSLLLIGMLIMLIINIFNIFAFPHTPSSSSSENRNLSATPLYSSTPLFTNFDNCKTEKNSSPFIHDNELGIDLFSDSCHKYVYYCRENSNKISWDKDITEITKTKGNDYLYSKFNDICMEAMDSKSFSISSRLSDVSIVLFISIYISTWLPVPFIYKAEIFPIRIRTKGSAIGTLTSRINLLIFMILCPIFYDLLGSKFCIFFTLNCIIGALFSIIACTESKGIPLEKMEEKMSGKIIEF